MFRILLYDTLYTISAVLDAEKRSKKLPTDPTHAKQLVEQEHRLGHFGRDAMKRSLMKLGWWWPKMTEDIDDLLTQCDACLAYNASKKGFEPFTAVTAKKPWDHIQVDTSIMKPSYPDGKIGFLCITDVFSGFVILRAIADTEATTVARELWDVFGLFGCPSILQSDNGTEYANKIVEALLELVGVDHARITVANSRADGLVENTIRNSQTMAHKETKGADVLWPLYIPFVQLCLNMHVNSRTLTRPFTMTFARDARPLIPQQHAIDSDKPFDFSDVVHSWENDISPYREYVRKVMSIIVPAIEQRTLETKAKMIANLNEVHRTLVRKPIPVGTEVYLKNPVEPLPKGQPLYVGPYYVTSAGTYGTYFLEDATRNPYPSAVKRDMLKVRVRLDRVVNGESEHKDGAEGFVPIDRAPLPERRRSGKRYEVEKLLEHKPIQKGGNYAYKVRWVGYGPEYDSWVNSTDLNAPVLLRAYWDAVQEAAARSPKRNAKKRAARNVKKRSA